MSMKKGREKTMPMYEYFCPECHSEFELLIRRGEQPVCPDCGNKKLTRHISAPAGHVTGSSTPCPAVSGTGHSCGAHCGCGHCPGEN